MTRRDAFLALFPFVVLIASYVFIIAALYTPATAPLEPLEREPYGGCDEAYAYPGTEGYIWCKEHGWNLP